MSLFKDTEEIFNNPWDLAVKVAAVNNRPMFTDWKDPQVPSIDDISLWEQISYTPGSIGIYAAHNPMHEMYIITHDLYLDKNYCEIFYGENAADEVYDRARKLGVEIELKKLWKVSPTLT